MKESLRKYDAETATWDKPAEVKRIMAEWEQAKVAAKTVHEEKLAKAKAEGKKEPRLRLPKEPADPRSGWSPPAALLLWQVLPQPRQGKAPIEGFIIAGKDRRWYPAKAQEKRVDGTWTIEVRSDLVAEPVAVRYGWASWPTGNLVGRERLPVPTFRTDDWPIVEGVSYSEEAKKASSAKIKAMQEEGKKLALDRKIRQLQIDLPKLESDLYSGDAKKQLESKRARIEVIPDELEKDPWLSRNLEKSFPEVVERVKAMRNTLRHHETSE